MLKIGLSLIFLYALFLFCRSQTDDLSLSRLSFEAPFDFPTLGSPEEAKEILNQKFTYLSSGGQCYVFASEDGKYVLKFFKSTPLPLPFSKYQAKKLGKLRRDMHGYLLAFERLQEDTGLVLVRLNSNPSFDQTVILFDKLNCIHPFCLRSTPFILQKRAQPLSSPLSASQLQSITDLLKKRAKAGISDGDPREHKNIGFIDEKPIFLDPGKFYDDFDAKEQFSEKFLKWQKK